MALFDDTRAAWGARRPKGALTFVAPSRRTEFMNHWNGGPTGLSAASDHARCLAVIKADQDFHMDGRGWSDIGYNGAICPHARAIECRGVDYSGAHCPDHNTSAYGWQFMLGTGETATPAMFARMARARADCAAHSGHDLLLMGHRDGFATECPGDQIEKWVKAGMPTTISAAPAQEDDVTPDDIKAIATEVFSRPVYDSAGNKRTVGEAIGITLRNSTSAATDARVARALAEASAKADKPLTAAEIDDIAKATVTAFGADYDAKVELTPKES